MIVILFFTSEKTIAKSFDLYVYINKKYLISELNIIIVMENQDKIKARTLWHRWFGAFIKILLEPLDIQVETDYPVMKELPETDVIIIRKKGGLWSKEQLKYIPDGIRQSKARYILLELKYTESINEDTIAQISGYSFFYRTSSKIKKQDLDAFIITSKTPSKKFRKPFGYDQTQWAGVFKSKIPVMRNYPIISLNDLSDKPYNNLFRVFASKKDEVFKGFVKVGEMHKTGKIPEPLSSFFLTFYNILYEEGEIKMYPFNFTPEEADRIYKEFKDAVLSNMEPEMLSNYFKIEDIMKSFKPEDIMKSFKPEDRLKGLKPVDRLKGLKPVDRLKGLKPVDRLKGLKPVDRLKGLTPEEILELESHIQSYKKRNNQIK